MAVDSIDLRNIIINNIAIAKDTLGLILDILRNSSSKNLAAKLLRVGKVALLPVLMRVINSLNAISNVGDRRSFYAFQNLLKLVFVQKV